MREWSGSRVTFWVLFLSLVFSLGSAALYSSTLLDLGGYQPEIKEALEKTFHCRVIVGHIHGELVPHLGVVVGPVVFVEAAHPTRVLASARSVHVWLSLRSLLVGKLRFGQIRFGSPRIIVHREKPGMGGAVWTSLAFSRSIGPSRPGSAPIDEWDIRNGQLEIWDHTVSPVDRWIFHPLTGSFQLSEQRGELTMKAPRFGRNFLLTLRYDGSQEFPIDAHVVGADLQTALALLHVDLPALDASAAVRLSARLSPLSIRATLEPTTFSRTLEKRLGGTVVYEPGRWQAHLQTGTTMPMVISVDGVTRRGALSVQGKISAYDPSVVQAIYSQAWLDRLEGPGTIDFSVQPSSTTHAWSASIIGHDFTLDHSAFNVPSISASIDAHRLTINVHGETAQGGGADVMWSHDGAADPELSVHASSVTLRQVLELFSLESKRVVPAGAAVNPFGYEAWTIQDGTMLGVLHSGSLEVQQGEFDFGEMHLTVTGTFGLGGPSPKAQVSGTLSDIPAQSTVEAFFAPPSPITGTGNLQFVLAFPLSPLWIAGLNGTATLGVDDGVLKLLKTAYRVVSVLNLGNYLKLRFPQLTAEGIVFNQLTGHLIFTNGVLSSDDLFLKSPNMNVGAKGAVDLAAQRIDCTLRLEMFRFLEDVLRDVPLTHWIFKKPTKIFLPLVVKVKGPWDNVDVE